VVPHVEAISLCGDSNPPRTGVRLRDKGEETAALRESLPCRSASPPLAVGSSMGRPCKWGGVARVDFRLSHRLVVKGAGEF
jgi:hypothetical protein